jgi:uncharacterized membrane protein
MSVPLRQAALRIRGTFQGQLEKRPWIASVVLVSVAFLVFAAYSIERYLAFQTNFFDLGLDSNSIWRTVNGYSSWQSLMLPSTPGHINHISPILGAVALIYWIVPDPRTLLVLQSAVVAGAALPLYFLALRETRSPLASVLVAGLYLANPGLAGIVRYDFHPESFIPLFIFLVYYAYGRTGGGGPYYISTLLLLTTIEYSAVLGLGVGLSLWVVKKRLDKRILVILGSSTALLAIILLSTLGNAFHSINWPSNWLAVQFFGNSFSQNGSYTQALGATLTNPSSILTALQTDGSAKITYFLVVLAPFWFASLRYVSRMIPALPWLTIVLATSKFSFTSFDFQYTAFVVPFISLAAIPFLARVVRMRRIVLALLLIALYVTVAYSALSPMGPDHQWPQPNPLAPTIASLNNMIPPNATILTQTDLFPQLSDRPYVTINYTSPDPPQYILVNTQSSWYNWTSPTLGYPASPSQQVAHFTSDYEYQLVFLDQGIRLYKLAGQSPLTTNR